MSIAHHPDDVFLAAYASGQLDLGHQIAIATHLLACTQCQESAILFIEMGGVLLEDLPAAEMSDGAFAGVSSQLDVNPPIHKAAPLNFNVRGLPDFVRRYPVRPWRMVAPGLKMRPILLQQEGPTHAFLLQSAAGAKLADHSHVGTEITCVLQGGFTHQGGHYGPGDFDLGDDAVDHRPVIDSGEDCLCLVVMEGRLQLKGFLGALLSPLVRL